jgi:hypothetical protein
MKKIFLSLFFLLAVARLKAQNFEFSVQANTGLSHYTGDRPSHSTNLNVYSVSGHSGYPNNDGTILSPCYGVDLQLQYTFKFNFIMGVQAGYEVISNKVAINGVYDGAATETAATGYVNQHNGYIDINPYLGYRFNINKVKLDILPGVDIAPGANTYNTVNVKASDGTFYNKYAPFYGGAPALELRYRLGLAAYYKKYGITAGYSHGKDIRNYNADGPVPSEYIEIFRLGISYRIK